MAQIFMTSYSPMTNKVLTIFFYIKTDIKFITKRSPRPQILIPEKI